MRNEDILLDYIHEGKYHKDLVKILFVKQGCGGCLDVIGEDKDGNRCNTYSLSPNVLIEYIFGLKIENYLHK